MRIAVIGSRGFSDRNTVDKWLSKFIKTAGDVVVSGGAKGADTLGADWARGKGYQVVEYLPDWDKYGKRAGFLRNEQIINDCDIVIAFWDGTSKGTGHSLTLAKKAKKTTIVIYF